MKKIIAIIILFIPLLGLAQQKELTKTDYINLVKQNPDSISSLVSLRRAGGYTPEYKELQPLFNSLSESVKSSTEGKEFQAYLDVLNRVSVGNPAIEFTQNDTAGVPFKLSELRGKYVLLDFWASWCPDCRVESPRLVQTYTRFKGDNFEILGISFDRDHKSWVKAIHDDKLHWKHVSDLKRWQNEVGTLYAVKSIPQNVLISPDGIIIARNIHGDELDAKLSELLGK